MTRLEVLHVTWVDSEAVNSWTPELELKEPLSVLHSVGLLIHKDKEKLVLAVSYDGATESANGAMTIPRKAIKKVRRLCTIKMT